MANEDVTKTDATAHPAALRQYDVPVLTIGYHPENSLVGQRCVLPDGDAITLGRASTLLGAGALQDELVSRRHARIERDGGAVRVIDLGSHNGTFVNGARTEQCPLSPGDVLGLGNVLLAFHRGPAVHRPPRHPRLIGVSSALARVLNQVEHVASQPTCVLIQGETGVGKELVAAEIHRQSGVEGAFVAVNCAAVADGVVHSELFGHVRGAFSGARSDRPGLVATALAGTLLLDEIGDATPALQASLLRLLEQGEFRPVGSDRPTTTDARFIAATHVPLSHAVGGGRFRRDLFGRVSRWVIDVPPLRERREDVVLLAQHFAGAFAGHPVQISRALAAALMQHSWPNNVRELRASIEQLLVAAGGAATELDVTPELIERLAAAHGPVATPPVPATPSSNHRARPRTERPSKQRLIECFDTADGNLRVLAEQLGVSRRTIYRWLDEADLDLPALRARRRGPSG